MNIAKQECIRKKDNTEDNRIAILCDKEGYLNLTNWIFNMLTVYSGNFVCSDVNDYLVSCSPETFYKMIHDMLFIVNHNKTKNVPSLLYKIFTLDEYKDIREPYDTHHVQIDLKYLKSKSDSNEYEIIYQKDWENMEENVLMNHLHVSVEIVTDAMTAKYLEVGLKKPYVLIQNDIDGFFIKPKELTPGSALYDSWKQICTSANELKDALMKDGCSTKVAKSVLPEATAKKIKISASLSCWHGLFSYLMYINAYQVSENFSELIESLLDMFEEYSYIEKMNTLIRTLRFNINQYETLPF